MIKVVCYGDSNTFGYNPADASRYDENTRWTAILQKKLGDEYKVVNEGACDRTGFVNNQKGFLFSAPRHFPKFLSTNKDIDILILALGTNDLQFQYNISMGAIERGLETLIDLAKENAKQIIVISPPILNEAVLRGHFSYQFDETSIVKSRKIGRIFRQISNAKHAKLFDINKFALPCDIDGLHYDAKVHKLIGEKLAEFIRN